MNETKNHYKKVFTLHYWRFFWFKYLFSLFCITLICLWSCLPGNITLRRIHRVRAKARAGCGAEAKRETKRSSHIHTHTPIMSSWLYACIKYIYELACAYSTQTFVFVFLRVICSFNSFRGPGPSSDPWLRRKYLLELQLPLGRCDFQKGRASDFQHETGR